MVIKYPCGICEKPVKKNKKAIVCDNCTQWVHCKCNNVPVSDYFDLMNDENDDTIDANKKNMCLHQMHQ